MPNPTADQDPLNYYGREDDMESHLPTPSPAANAEQMLVALQCADDTLGDGLLAGEVSGNPDSCVLHRDYVQSTLRKIRDAISAYRRRPPAPQEQGLVEACHSALNRLVYLQGPCSGCPPIDGMGVCVQCQLTKALSAHRSSSGEGGVVETRETLTISTHDSPSLAVSPSPTPPPTGTLPYRLPVNLCAADMGPPRMIHDADGEFLCECEPDFAPHIAAVMNAGPWMLAVCTDNMGDPNMEMPDQRTFDQVLDHLASLMDEKKWLTHMGSEKSNTAAVWAVLLRAKAAQIRTALASAKGEV